MVRTRSAVREKMRDKLRQARLSKFGVVKKNKLKLPSQKAAIIPVGKAIAIDSQSESDSDFDASIHVAAKSSSPQNDRIRAVGGNCKRPMNRIYSDEGDSDGPTKGIKGHKSNSQFPIHKCNLLGFGDYFKDRKQLVRIKLNLSSQSEIMYRLDMISSKQSLITNGLLEVKTIFTDFRSDVLTMLQTIQTAVQNAAPHDTPLDVLADDPIEVPTQMFEEIIRSATKQKPTN